MGTPGGNWSPSNAPVVEAGNNPYGVLVSMSPEISAVATGEGLDEDRIIDFLMRMFYLTIHR